ncbi:MAG TPA: glycosyltransferase family 2 protein [Candidatus Hydrogenedentes bacterium]|nr:glycosyltransferase family 2 protein [Candidatus Hydrogenedentota bacterium]HOR49766.1 glycosyltransferase family 2 protein [Candidatus Hydrogenedentota bacterium]HPK25635.1 glycosyltransferase family 2 protein [Candidatus Hydrogenedentota bacterium]HQB02651.1 glycosyltransferase family 2 protein [Candidatus Hydrogenedentota bacterium]
MRITFVIPAYNEAPTLAALAEGIKAHVGAHDFRILFVDDGSTDNSWEILEGLRREDARIDLLRLRRNCGKTAALEAAFARVSGDVLITMDADLQDDPAEIPRMLAKLDEGYDLVCGWKKKRHDPWLKTIPSRFYNARISRRFKLPLHDINTGFKAMRMEVAKRLRLWSDMHRLIPVFAAHLGYKVTEIPVRHHPRKFGKSKYGFSRIQKGLVDIESAAYILKYQDAPMRKIYISQGGLLYVLLLVLLTLSLALIVKEAPEALILLLFSSLAIALYFLSGCFFRLAEMHQLIQYRMPPPDPGRFVAAYHATPWADDAESPGQEN